MNKEYLSKSRYCKYIQCQKILWLRKYKPDKAVPADKDAVYESGRIVGELARNLFGKYENVEFNEDLSKMIEKTDQFLKNKPNVIAEASFDYNNNFCSVDILKNLFKYIINIHYVTN